MGNTDGMSVLKQMSRAEAAAERTILFLVITENVKRSNKGNIKLFLSELKNNGFFIVNSMS